MYLWFYLFTIKELYFCRKIRKKVLQCFSTIKNQKKKEKDVHANQRNPKLIEIFLCKFSDGSARRGSKHTCAASSCYLYFFSFFSIPNWILIILSFIRRFHVEFFTQIYSTWYFYSLNCFCFNFNSKNRKLIYYFDPTFLFSTFNAPHRKLLFKFVHECKSYSWHVFVVNRYWLLVVIWIANYYF